MTTATTYACALGVTALLVLAVSPANGQARATMRTVKVPMRDGVKLSTRVHLPGPGRHPAILSRGYNSQFAGNVKTFNKAGYVCVGQACRGGGGSDGSRFFPDEKDGYDTIEWIAKQPWCDGNVAMYGPSYWGATQWRAALAKPPHLKAIVPQATSADLWGCGYRRNGAVTLAMTAHGRAGNKTDLAFYRRLPLIDLDRIGTGGENKLWNDYISHSQFDEFWKAISMRADGADRKYERIRIPAYITSGWWDYYAGSSLTSFARLKEVNATPEVRVILGPGNHSWVPPNSEVIRWLDYVVRGIDTGVKDDPPVKIYVMGANKWRLEKQWPLARTRFTRYYFSSKDGSRVGPLSTRPPGAEPPTKYVYDPNDPVPTLGGCHSWCWGKHPHLPVGSHDHRANERREDVLVFTTEPLAKDTEVTGPITVKLFAATDAKDTDWTAILLDVHPSGKAMNLCEGILRARFRESIYKPPRLLVPGKVYEYTLTLAPTSNVFKRGHRIRVHLSSSNFPLWDRNLNTGEDIARGTKMRAARQTIYHDKARPSHILLPIVPARPAK